MSETSPRVAVMMGSASDMDVMAEAVRELERFGVGVRVAVTSAHRSPERTLEFVRRAERDGIGVFIVGAGMAAHLAGVVAAHTVRPVIGVPTGGLSGGLDALLSTVQMPRGVPVATVAVGRSGAANAGILACQILAGSDPDLARALAERRRAMAEEVAASQAKATERLDQLLGRAPASGGAP